MKKINIGLLGASGKMGLAVRSCLKNSNFIPYIAISSKNCPEFKNHFSDVSLVPDDLATKVDVWLDFSSINGLMLFLKRFKNIKTTIVSGTTGLSKSEFAQLQKFSKKSAVFWSSNMSPGLWALRQSLKSMNLISDFKFEISETHHIEKKDNPSGTAVTLQNDLQKILDRKLKRPVGHRQAGVFGIHQVLAKSKSEILKFEHVALNRTVFAQGALKAAAFLVKKPQGFYSMEDLNTN